MLDAMTLGASGPHGAESGNGSGANGGPELSVRERVQAVVAAHRDDRGPLLPVLHDVQATFGHIDPSVIPVIAEELNLSRADVHGVVTFYRDFRRAPGGE